MKFGIIFPKKETQVNNDKDQQTLFLGVNMLKRISLVLAVVMFWTVQSYAEVKKEFYPSGKLKLEFSLNTNGKMEGIHKVYYESGKLKSEGNYINGKLEGIVKWYYERGNLWIEANYKSGKLISRKIYNAVGDRMN